MDGPVLKRVVVTGAAGLIGRAVTGRLAADGHDVVAIHRSGVPERLTTTATWHQLDLLTDDAASSINQLAPDVLVHCAAVLPTAFDGDAAQRASEANMVMDEAVTSAFSGRIIYLSSVSVYGLGPDLFSETGPVQPSGPYAEAKLATERLLESRDDHVIFRVSAAYGPGQAMSTVLKLFIGLAQDDNRLSYHGSGARCQDFVAATDVAAAAAAAVSIPSVVGTINVASGHPISMFDLAHLVVEITGSESTVAPSGVDDPQENHRARYDVGRVTELVGRWPTVDLATGIGQLTDSAT